MKKDKVFKYECPYTKEQLYEKLNNKHGVYSDYGKEGDYLIELKNDGFFLGIERAGHTGYWYNAAVRTVDDRIIIQGKIVYDPDENGNEKPCSKKEKFGSGLIIIICIPAWTIFMLCYGIAWLIRFIIGKPMPKEKSKEQKLDDFMCNYLCCKKL